MFGGGRTISNRIKLLPELMINKIAAGEVIERPASAIKEMVENAIDAGADYIQIEVKGSGQTYIRVTDNGHGMHPEDALLAFERHATSKISQTKDLESIETLGFRGEALSSIASVAKVRLVTRCPSEIAGTEVKIESGKIKSVRDIASAPGTSIEIRNLFYNLPARKKFLKKETTEMTYISDVIGHYVLAFPEISFSVSRNNKVILQSPGNSIEEEALLTIYGESIACEMLRIVTRPNYENEDIKIGGFISRPSIARSSNRFITVLVNKRFVRSRLLNKAVSRACSGLFSQEKYPIVVLDIEIPPHLVDVNVHPQKLEVRFRDEKFLYMVVLESIQHTLLSADLIKEIQINPEKERKDLEKNFDLVSTSGKQGELFQEKVKPVKIYNQVERQGPTSLPASKPQPIIGSSQSKFATIEPLKAPLIYRGEKAQKSPLEDNAGKVIPLSGKGGLSQISHTSAISDNQLFSSAYLDDQNRVEQGVLEKMNILGQFDDCFILGTSGKSILIVDQHVAHERVLFEKLMKQYSVAPIKSQALLFPCEMKLLPGESPIIRENQEIFEKLGFCFSFERDGAIFVTSIPTLLSNDNDHKLIQDSINGLLHEIGQQKGYAELKIGVITMMSCKMAIKANKTLVPEEMEALMEQLLLTENPFFCPHGRPIVLKITRQQLNRLFQRN
ncbi:DNA mismatch repair endonuclease MutL [Candidatus Riflebacteria bacterium]